MNSSFYYAANLGRAGMLLRKKYPSTISLLKNYLTKRETDFILPTNSLASPNCVCLMKNNFVTFDLVEQQQQGEMERKSIQISEYLLNGDRIAQFIFNMKELEAFCNILNKIAEAPDGFKSAEEKVEETKLNIRRRTDQGLAVLKVKHTTPIYKNRPPLIIPLDNLKEFINQIHGTCKQKS